MFCICDKELFEFKVFIVYFCCVEVCRDQLGGHPSNLYWILWREVGLSGRTHSGTVESGREYCGGRKRPAYRYTERGKCVEHTYRGLPGA